MAANPGRAFSRPDGLLWIIKYYQMSNTWQYLKFCLYDGENYHNHITDHIWEAFYTPDIIAFFLISFCVLPLCV